MSFDVVIWDWNGTLLRDVEVNIDTINALLGERGLPAIDRESYLDGFNIPVKAYYAELGFELERESFDAIAEEYVREYGSRISRCSLYDGAEDALRALRGAGVRQFVVSAAEDSRLKKEVASYGIAGYFDGIFGKEDNLGGGKLAVAERLLAGLDEGRDRVLFVGDLTHDFEVASALGCASLLIPEGHQSRRRLAATGADLAADITGVAEYVLGSGCGVE